MFQGFSPAAVTFLAGLKEHNDTTWFEDHRSDYERFLVQPMRALVTEFREWFEAEVDAGIETRPQVGRAIGRIRRDTRFTGDKRPYKETVWVIFRNRRAVMGTLGFYWELGVERWAYGMGFYSAPPRVLQAIRERALAAPERFCDALAPIEERRDFEVQGQPYHRSRMAGAPARLVHWLDRRNLYVDGTRPHDEILYGPGLVDFLWDSWRRLVPLYWFLRDSAGVTRRSLPAGLGVRRGE